MSENKHNKNFRKIIGLILYCIGFIGFVAFLTAAKTISTQAWLYAIGASVGTLLFSISGYFRE